MKSYKQYLNERMTRDEFRETLIKKLKSKKYVEVKPVESYHQSSMIYIQITVPQINENQWYMISTKDDELVCGSSSDSVNYSGTWFKEESEVIADINKWYKSHEEQLKVFANLEKLYGKLGNNLEIGEDWGKAKVVPIRKKLVFSPKLAEKLASKLKLDFEIEMFNHDIEYYHFGDKSKNKILSKYHNDFSIQVWSSPAGLLRDIDAAVLDWAKPSKIFAKAITEIDKL